jgi:hypothetical protein
MASVVSPEWVQETGEASLCAQKRRRSGISARLRCGHPPSGAYVSIRYSGHDLLQIVERIIFVKSKVMLMTNPSESRYSELCDVIEATYQALTSDDPQAVAKIRAGSEAITRAGREVRQAVS